MSTTPRIYKVRPGTLDFGKSYEVKITSLISLKCCLEDFEDFWLALNVKECEALDDLVLYTKKRDKRGITYLIQLKHQNKPKPIVRNQFLSYRGDFSLEKYLNSCLKVSDKVIGPNRQKSEIISHFRKNPQMVFVLFTNKDVAGDFGFLVPVLSKSKMKKGREGKAKLSGLSLKMKRRMRRKKKIHASCTNFINISGNVYRFIRKKIKIFESPSDWRKQLLKKVFLHTNQPHFKEVDNKMKDVLKRLVKKSDLDQVIEKFGIFVENWSRGLLNGHYPLTKALVLKKITEILLEPFMVRLDQNLRTPRERSFEMWNEMIEDKDVIFVNRSDEIVEEFINKSIFRCIEEHKGSVKNCPSLEKHLMRRIPEDFADVYEYFWKARKVPLVVQVRSKEEIEEVVDILKVSQGSFQVVILNKSEVTLDNLISSKGLFKVSDLNEKYQKELFNIPIKLQGRRLVDYRDVGVIKEMLELSVRDMVYILCGRFNIGKEFEALPHIFVDISLKRVCLKIEVLKRTAGDIFVIHCENLEDFGHTLQTSNLDIDDSQIFKWQHTRSDPKPKNIILYEDSNDIRDIKEFFREKHVHYLILRKNLEWVESTGKIEELRKFRQVEESKDKVTVTKEEIEDFCRKISPLVVSANPGMGKSVFVDYFAWNAPSDFWVIKMSLAKYQAAYCKFARESDLKLFFDDVLKEECKENLFLAKAVFDKLYELQKIAVLLDGYDEILIEYRDDAKRFIKLLRRSGCFILVTTRPVLVNDLETLLDTFSLDLNLFTRQDQQYFLSEYFFKSLKMACKVEIGLYVENLLDAAKYNLNDQDNEFTGIPLQTLLVAETFLEDCKEFMDTKRFANKHFDLLYLYNNFIERKFNIACEKSERVSRNDKILYKIYKVFYAMRLLFSKEDLKRLETDFRLKYGNCLPPHMLELMQKDGIVVAETETNVQFIHRTFAEYLTGEWLAENILKNDIAKNLLKLTFDPNMKFVRNIFDRILAKNCPLHLAVINLQDDKIIGLIESGHSSDLDRGGRNYLHLLASWGFYHLQRFTEDDNAKRILNLVLDEELKTCRDRVLECTPLDYALISSSLHIARTFHTRAKGELFATYIEQFRQAFLLHSRDWMSLALTFIKIGFKRDAFNTETIEKIFSLTTPRNAISYDNSNFSPLHVAVRFEEKEEILRLLIDAGVDLDLTDSSGKTPLHWSVLYGYLRSSEILVSEGADVNVRDDQGRTALHYAVILCPKHQLEIISILSKTDLQIKDVNGMTPLLWAAYYGYTECLGLLLDIEQKGADGHIDTAEVNAISTITNTTSPISSHLDIVDLQDTNGMSALHWAICNDHQEVAFLLLENKASIDTENGVNPLCLAARYGRTGIAELLLKYGANIKTVDSQKMTSLHWAAFNGHEDTVELLLSKGANINSRDENGNTALSCATAGGHTQIVELLEKIKFEGYADPLLDMHTDNVSLLLKEGADIESRNDINETPTKHDKKGADVRAKDEKSALHWAIYNLELESAELLLLKSLDLIESRTAKGETPLILAAQQGCEAMVKLFLSKNANTAAKDCKGMNPLHWASHNGHDQIVALLLRNNADLEAKDNDGRTALILASQNGHKKVVEWLLSNKADISTTDKDGLTALSWAERNKHEDVVGSIKKLANRRFYANKNFYLPMLAALAALGLALTRR